MIVLPHSNVLSSLKCIKRLVSFFLSMETRWFLRFLAPRNFRLIPNNERARDRICLKEFLPQVDNFMSELMLIATTAAAAAAVECFLALSEACPMEINTEHDRPSNCGSILKTQHV